MRGIVPNSNLFSSTKENYPTAISTCIFRVIPMIDALFNLENKNYRVLLNEIAQNKQMLPSSEHRDVFPSMRMLAMINKSQ